MNNPWVRVRKPTGSLEDAQDMTEEQMRQELLRRTGTTGSAAEMKRLWFPKPTPNAAENMSAVEQQAGRIPDKELKPYAPPARGPFIPPKSGSGGDSPGYKYDTEFVFDPKQNAYVPIRTLKKGMTP